MHRIRENFKHGKLYLTRDPACNMSGLLMGCFENVLSFEKKYCSDLRVLPLPPHQHSFKLF